MEERTLENTYPEGPADKGQLLEWIEREWVTLMEPVRALPPERLEKQGNGGWSIKDHVAHLSFWEQMLVRSYLGGEPPNTLLGVTDDEFQRLDEDGINAAVQRQSHSQPAANVLAEAELMHGEVVEAIARVTWERLWQPVREGSSTLLGWLIAGNTYGHYMEHANWLREMLKAE